MKSLAAGAYSWTCWEQGGDQQRPGICPNDFMPGPFRRRRRRGGQPGTGQGRGRCGAGGWEQAAPGLPRGKAMVVGGGRKVEGDLSLWRHRALPCDGDAAPTAPSGLRGGFLAPSLNSVGLQSGAVPLRTRVGCWRRREGPALLGTASRHHPCCRYRAYKFPILQHIFSSAISKTLSRRMMEHVGMEGTAGGVETLRTAGSAGTPDQDPQGFVQPGPENPQGRRPYSLSERPPPPLGRPPGGKVWSFSSFPVCLLLVSIHARCRFVLGAQNGATRTVRAE